ncbi:hypothetical protein D3C83_83860 [compost metagenome]
MLPLAFSVISRSMSRTRWAYTLTLGMLWAVCLEKKKYRLMGSSIPWRTLRVPGESVNSLFCVRSSRTPLSVALLMAMTASSKAASTIRPTPEKRG